MKNFNRQNREDRRNSGDRQMFQAVCDKCGKNCQVPFQPSGDKPIYCSDCFDKNKNFGAERSGGRDSGRPSFSNKQMFSVVCAKCDKKCEVPFKPSGDKPVYCKDCFSHNRNNENKNFQPNTQSVKDDFTIINAKLDKILSALNQDPKATTVNIPNKTMSIHAEKKPVVKKTVKKKVVVAAKTKKRKN